MDAGDRSWRAYLQHRDKQRNSTMRDQPSFLLLFPLPTAYESYRAQTPTAARDDNEPHRAPPPLIRQPLQRLLRNPQPLNFCPDAQHRLDFLPHQRVRPHDHAPVEEVEGHTVGGLDAGAGASGFGFGASDGGEAAVGGEDDVWGEGGFEGSIEVGEAFDVEHVYLGR
jgi:hypothetical protein